MKIWTRIRQGTPHLINHNSSHLLLVSSSYSNLFHQSLVIDKLVAHYYIFKNELMLIVSFHNKLEMVNFNLSLVTKKVLRCTLN